MITFWNRTLSLLVFIGYVVAARQIGALTLMLKMALPLLLALACIWFPDALGDFTGVVYYQPITTGTPA